MRPTPLIELTCKWCDKPFKVKFKYREQKFCSLACTGHYGNRNKVNKFQKPCKICSKPLTTIPSRVAKGRGKYCSKECYTVAMKGVPHASPSEETKMKLSEQRRGKLNPAFKHGESESMSQYNSRFNKMLKDKIMTRDNHQCNWCGVKNKRLVVHHLDHNKLNNDYKNLITLCIHCHSSYHRQYEWDNGLR
ncbi:MAG TPA: HNH endonuclease signature motif containing protein [Patescibacteria group bacterium]